MYQPNPRPYQGTYIHIQHNPNLNLRGRRKLSPHLIRDQLLIINEINTVMGNSRLRPTLKPGSLLQQSRQLSRNKPMLRLSEAQNPQQERARLHLRQRQFLTTTKERALALRVCQQRLDLLYDGSDQLLGGSITLGVISGANTREEWREDFAEEGVDEEVETGAVEGIFGWGGWRKEVALVGICEELGDDA